MVTDTVEVEGITTTELPVAVVVVVVVVMMLLVFLKLNDCT